MAIIKTQEIKSAGENVEKRELSCIVGGSVNWCSHYKQQYGGSSKNSKIELSYDPAILLLGIYPKKTETLIQKYICTPMCIATLFTIAKI